MNYTAGKKLADVPGGANIVVLPSGEVRRCVADIRRDCEFLRQSVDKVLGCLEQLEHPTMGIREDSTRERLQRELLFLNRSLLLRLDQLSGIDCSLNEIVRSAVR